MLNIFWRERPLQTSLLERIIIEPSERAKRSVIWLHGLGASGDDFSDIIPLLHLSDGHAIRFIFPHAIEQPVTINGGMKMPAWYDIRAINLFQNQDSKGILQSEQYIQSLIAHEVEQGIPVEQIALMGFSQGGAIALHTALHHESVLAGVGALSAYLPMGEYLIKQKPRKNLGIPIFIAHGLYDPVVPYQAALKSYETLTQMGYEIETHRYEMAHMVCPQECQAIGRWLQDIFTL